MQPQVADPLAEPVTVEEDYGQIPENSFEEDSPFLAVCEKEILYYLLKFGEHRMHFDEHQYVGSEAPVMDITISQYISAELKNDDLVFQNSLYRKIYDLYFEYSSENLNEEQIVRRLTSGPEEIIAKTVLDIIFNEYVVNVKEFKKTLIPEEDVLGIYVPKSIIIYKSKITDLAYNEIMERLRKAQSEGDTELQKQLMRQIKVLMIVKNQFSKELNRLT